MNVRKTLFAVALACALTTLVNADDSTFGFESQEENLNESTFGFESQLPMSDEEQEILKLKQQTMFENIKEKLIKKDYGKFVENEKVQNKTKMVYTLRELLKDPNISAKRKAKLTALLKKYEKEEREQHRDYKNFMRQTNKELSKNRKERQQKLDKAVEEIKNRALENNGVSHGEQKDSDGFFNLQGYVKPQIQYVRYEPSETQQLKLAYPRLEMSEGDYQRLYRPVDYNYRTLNEAQRDLSDGVILPNRPVYVSPERKAQMKKVIRAFFNQGGIARMKAYEREAFNAMIFNYGLQLLETGEVVELEFIDDYTGGRPMLTPDIPMPENAQQVNIGGYNSNDSGMEVY
ncbi:MAG: hypothetical protein II731_03960 [Succinivibrio sp.]|uniref:hypothetical protein n=1 Tax=uncultured Succinivibrio sp. TaxID=540749 RepID=UPI0025D7B35F|nr:hypothetical protein [uncultured Succinivibrio sp.]MBQ3884015.1 hypothetical protein [Succinivibrio sp.]